MERKSLLILTPRGDSPRHIYLGCVSALAGGSALLLLIKGNPLHNQIIWIGCIALCACGIGSGLLGLKRGLLSLVLSVIGVLLSSTIILAALAMQAP